MATEVPVTPSQVKAAKRIVERDSANGRETSEAIRKIAEATAEPLPGQRTTRIIQKTDHSDTQVRTTRQVTGEVLWSAQAESDLEDIAPVIRQQLRRNAGVTLPDTQPCAWAGSAHGIMWHRGINHEQEHRVEELEEEDADGIQPRDYYLFYRKLDPNGFEVLAVRSIHQIANLARHTRRESSSDADDFDQWLMEMAPAIVGRSHGSSE